MLPIVAPDQSSQSPDSLALVLLFAPVAALVTVAFLGAAHWTRRSDYALYRLLGWGRGQLLVMILWEWGATVLAAATAGLVLGLSATDPLAIAPEFRPLLLTALGSHLLVLCVGPALTLVAATRLAPVDALKGA